MEFAFGNQQKVFKIKEHADYRYVQMPLQILAHIQGVRNFKLAHNVLR